MSDVPRDPLWTARAWETLAQAEARIAELERWQKVDLENYKRHLVELEEKLAAATDLADRRGKQLDAIRWWHSTHIPKCAICKILDGEEVL